MAEEHHSDRIVVLPPHSGDHALLNDAKETLDEDSEIVYEIVYTKIKTVLHRDVKYV